MKLLLDSHIFLWLLSEPEKIPPALYQRMSVSNGELTVSIVSIWELAIKLMSGKLHLVGGLDGLLWRTGELGFTVVPVKTEHVRVLGELPSVHKDPFDRMLVAQSIAEESVLVTVDRELQQYPVRTL